jgi:hypothetical protein
MKMATPFKKIQLHKLNKDLTIGKFKHKRQLSKNNPTQPKTSQNNNKTTKFK